MNGYYGAGLTQDDDQVTVDTATAPAPPILQRPAPPRPAPPVLERPAPPRPPPPPPARPAPKKKHHGVLGSVLHVVESVAEVAAPIAATAFTGPAGGAGSAAAAVAAPKVELPDAFAGDLEVFADFFQSALPAAVQPVSGFQDFGFARFKFL